MKRLLFTIFALCVLCVGLQAQNTNTTDKKGVTSQGQLDTVRNTRLNPTGQNEQIQSKFVDQFGNTGQRPGLSPHGQRLKAVIKITSSSLVNNGVLATTATIAATVSDSGDYALPIIERGVCYASSANPTLLTATKKADATISGKGFGNFNVTLSGLQPHTAYHARAYAVSMYDTVYGEDLAFTTLFAGSISYSTTVVEKMSTEPAFTNPLTKVGDGTVTYSKSGDNHNICTVNANTGEVTLTGNAGTCTITATVTNSSSYAYAKKTASYTLTVKTMLQIPLTFEAKKAGATVAFTPCSGSSLNPTLEFSVNGTTWNNYPSDSVITLVNIGDKVMFRGDNSAFAYGTSLTSTSTQSSRFTCTGQCYLYGNMMSLLNKTSFATAKSLNRYAFYALFYQNTSIYSHDDKKVVLPATTLAERCYSQLFSDCSNLTSAPELPATSLANSCYSSMFYGCSSLTSAPELPATTLANNCYEYMFAETGLSSVPALPVTTLANYCYSKMFKGCTDLTSLPAGLLPATTLKTYCYSKMFEDCTGLTSLPTGFLPATTLATYCYYQMFDGCTGLTSLPAGLLPATTLETFCYGKMFYDCSGLTTAPMLPAASLANSCYYEMFRNCSSLNSITCLATEGMNTDNSTKNWLSGVASPGTFYKHANAQVVSGSYSNKWSKNSVNGIPSGWTVAAPFSVSSTKQVYFSKGNLQYQASTGTWRFAEHQWDFVGDATNGNVYVGNVKSNNALIASNYSGWIDLFGWGTSGYNHGANCYQPYSTSQAYTDYYAYGSQYYNLYDQTGRADWGYTASTVNLGSQSDWYTLTVAEWGYVFNTRSTTSNVRYAKAKVNGVAGVILLPDNWSTNYYSLTSTNTASADYTTNIISSSDWTNYFEANGAVFLPAVGRRWGTSIYNVGENGNYWSSSYQGVNNSYRMYFTSSSLNPQENNGRYDGYAVRLVRNAN